jgi:carbon monoxide dehydrogenase subunit G
MKMSGEHVIAADRQAVWDALNDPQALKEAIPGCESVERTADNEFESVVAAKVGPVRARFKGKIQLTDLNPPTSYTITGEGSGGAAGFAKGSAKVSLSDADGGTRLAYDVDATVGGKLAQIGQRLIDGTARKMADEFFANFAARFGPPAAAPETAAVDRGPIERMASAIDEDQQDRLFGMPRSQVIWGAGIIVALFVLYALFG